MVLPPFVETISIWIPFLAIALSLEPIFTSQRPLNKQIYP
jgi:hypothetical protein